MRLPFCRGRRRAALREIFRRTGTGDEPVLPPLEDPARPPVTERKRSPVELEVRHPATGEPLRLEAPLDAAWQRLLGAFGWEAALAGHAQCARQEVAAP